MQKAKPTLADTLRLYPQTRKVLNHIERRGSISPLEAFGTYGMTRLGARIFELRRAGFNILTDLRADEMGRVYARYTLAA